MQAPIIDNPLETMVIVSKVLGHVELEYLNSSVSRNKSQFKSDILSLEIRMISLFCYCLIGPIIWLLSCAIFYQSFLKL